MDQQALPTPRDKLLNLQILRFIAAFGVLASHAAALTLPRGSWFWLFPWTAGVDVFFVISGMIMTIVTAGRFGKAGAARDFLLRRIIRIAPIYWLFTMVMIATIVLFPGQVRYSQADPASIATSLSFFPWPRGDGQIVPILAQGWTLNYEAFFYLAFALALLHRHGLALLAASFTGLAMLHASIAPGLVPLRFWSDPIILEFIAGIGLAKLWLGGIRLRPTMTAILAVTSLALFCAAEPLGLGQYGRWIANGIPAALLSAAFLFAAEPANPGATRRALVASGDASYALYLSHTFTINAVVLLVGGRLAGWATMGAAVALAVLISLIVHRWIERPLLAALHHRIDREPGARRTLT